MKYLLVLLSLLLLGCANSDSVSPVDDTFEVAGVLKHDGQKWYILVDNNHISINLDRIDTYPDRAELIFSKTASKVITFLITPDETYARLGISAGASVGFYNAVIYYGQNGHAINSNQLYYPGSNFFVYGRFKK